MNDQYIIPLFIAGSLLLTLFTFFLIVYLVVQKRKQNNYQLEKQQMIFTHEKNILRAKIDEQENTMDQISKELHDNVKSVLGFSQMSMLKIAELATNQRQIEYIENTNQLIEKVREDVHNISHSLNSNFIKNVGLLETLKKDLENIQLSGNIQYDIAINGDEGELSPEQELQIYRIAQEVVQNCVKHAKATKLNFMFNFEPHLFTMNITDNGIGFDKKEVFEMKGLGLINMLQRARYAHGVLDVQSAPGAGSSITLTINLEKNGANN